MTLVATAPELTALAAELAGRSPIALDIESNGLFKYRASLCTLQLATTDGAWVVDSIATPLTPLGALLSVNGPRKIVHDIAFDARILAENGVILGNVFDTSLAARMLGRLATGLASLLQAELGITVDKKLQHHDWTERPLEPQQLVYLEGDVIHLPALAAKLQVEIDAQGIAAELEEETRYRLAQAAESVRIGDPRPPYVRLKGIDKVPRADVAILRHIAEIREVEARNLDVPPYKVVGPDVLFAIAKAKPRTERDLGNVKGFTGHRARMIASKVLAGIERGLAEPTIPAEDEHFLERPRVPAAIAKARRGREHRLNAWRRAEAKKRGVDEQVVMPGHCLQDLADLEHASLADVENVPGIGKFRVERDGEALVAALAERVEEPA